MEDALSALHLRHTAFRLCLHLGVEQTAAELVSQLSDETSIQLLSTVSASRLCRDATESKSAGVCRLTVDTGWPNDETFLGVICQAGMLAHADALGADGQLRIVLRAACSAFSRLQITSSCGYAERCDLTSILQLVVESIAAKVHLRL